MAKNSSNVSFRIQQERTEGTYINMTRFCFRHTSLHHMEQHHRTAALSSSSSSSFTETMEKRQLNQEKTEGFTLLPSLFPNLVSGSLICAEEVSSTERELTDMSEEEVDLIYRMHRLVGDRWELIAGRIPGRTPEEIKRFWKMKKDPCFAEKGLKRKRAVEGTVAEVQNQK